VSDYSVTGIALSGSGRDEDIRRRREAGLAGHLTQPIDLRRREAMIRQVAS
jgi:CheY-like chemotaxis protein